MYNFSYHNFHVEIVPVGQRWDIKLTHSWPFYTARSGSCSLIFHVHQIVAITYHAFRSHPCWEKNQGAYFIFLLTVFPIFIPITLCRSTAVGLAKTMPVGTFSSLLMGSIIATAKEFIIEIWRSITAKFQEKKKGNLLLSDIIVLFLSLCSLKTFFLIHEEIWKFQTLVWVHYPHRSIAYIVLSFTCNISGVLLCFWF